MRESLIHITDNSVRVAVIAHAVAPAPHAVGAAAVSSPD
jgi:hypothetical protein